MPQTPVNPVNPANPANPPIERQSALDATWLRPDDDDPVATVFGSVCSPA